MNDSFVAPDFGLYSFFEFDFRITVAICNVSNSGYRAFMELSSEDYHLLSRVKSSIEQDDIAMKVINGIRSLDFEPKYSIHSDGFNHIFDLMWERERMANLIKERIATHFLISGFPLEW